MGNSRITIPSHEFGTTTLIWGSTLYKGALKPYEYGTPGEIRTPDRLVRSQVLYPAELRARIEKRRLISGWKRGFSLTPAIIRDAS